MGVHDTVYDTIVVGAGISGLAHAWWHHAAGRRVLLLEASDRVGGVIRTDAVKGFRIERAARSIPSSASNVRALVDALPDGPTLVPAAPSADAQYLLRRKGLVRVPRTPPALILSDLLTPWAKVRAFSEILRPARRVQDGPPETLAQFVTRRFGRAVTETLLRPFTSGVYGASPDRLGAADAFPQLVAMEQRRGSVIKALMARKGQGGPKREVLMVEGGMHCLPQAIADALGETVRLETPVSRIEPVGDGTAQVVTASGETFVARELALAVPAMAQARLLADRWPEVADALAAVPYVAIAVVAVGFAKDRAPPLPDAFGFLRAPDADARILGATFFSKLSPDVAPEGHELVDVFVGGSEDPEGAALSDDDLAYVVVRDLGRALGGEVRPALLDIHRWPRAIPLFAPGHRGRMAALTSALSASGIRLLGSHATGVSLDQCCLPAAPLSSPLVPGLERV